MSDLYARIFWRGFFRTFGAICGITVGVGFLLFLARAAKHFGWL